MNIPIELRETWKQIDQALLMRCTEFHERLDFEQALEDIKQINRSLNRLVEYEKRNTANTGIIAKHLGLIACAIGFYVLESPIGDRETPRL